MHLLDEILVAGILRGLAGRGLLGSRYAGGGNPLDPKGAVEPVADRLQVGHGLRPVRLREHLI